MSQQQPLEADVDATAAGSGSHTPTTPTWVILLIYGGLLGGLLYLSSYLEKKAALRGTHRKRLDPKIDKAIRAFFLLIFIFPIATLTGIPVMVVLYLLYLPFYLDGSERRGRPGFLSKILQTAPPFQWIIDYWNVSWDSEIDEATGKPYVLKNDTQYIIGLHPHGILPIATITNLTSPLADFHNSFLGATGKRLRTLAASFCFMIPVYRDILVAGNVIDAARYNARAALDEGYSLALVPGGATEALYGGPGEHALFIKKRTGFIRLALETGATLVPCYSFGENELYGQLRDTFPAVKKLALRFQSIFGISLPLVTNIWPRKCRVVTVCAKPIPVARVEDPSEEQVQALLSEYIAALERVFNTFAEKYEPKKEARKIAVF